MTDQIERRVEILTRVWLAWFAAYMLLGSWAMMNGGISFLAGTVDHVDSLWAKLIFLNIPLQIVLALITGICSRSSKPGLKSIGLGVAVVNTILVLVHLALSLCFKFAQ